MRQLNLSRVSTANRWACALLLCSWMPHTAAFTVTESEIEALLNNNEAEEAARRIDEAENRDEFLRVTKAKAFYSASICYSPPNALSTTLIDRAQSMISEALAAVPPLSDAVKRWAQTVSIQCELCKPQLRRVTRVKTERDEWGGKIAHNCEIRTPSELAAINADSLRLLPRLPALSEHAVETEKLVETVRTEHALDDADVGVCAPFIVASATDSVQDICSTAAKFLAYFGETFAAPSIGAWIVIHHYADEAGLDAHAERHGGPPCKGILGYYDPLSQRVSYRATPGLHGTLQHELAHALIYWDAPEIPRWLDEGIAALHENTDANYAGLANPWRQGYLNTPIDDWTFFCDDVLRMEIAEFEATPRPASVSRFAMRRIQKNNALPALYRDVRDDTSLQSLNYEPPDSETLERLQRLPGIQQFCAH